jgi:hypothetical protein
MMANRINNQSLTHGDTMQGQKSPPESQLFVYADPYAKLPRHGFYGALEKHLELAWVREATKGLYADGVGRPSLDPVVFVKLMLVAYFENLPGDSELAFRIADSLTVRRFLGYGVEEATPGAHLHFADSAALARGSLRSHLPARVGAIGAGRLGEGGEPGDGYRPD